MSKIWAVVALVVVALGGGWYFGSPYWTVSQMSAAAKAGDADRLSGYVDYPSLRASVKAQARVRLRDSSALGVLADLLPTSLVDAVVDSVVTPKGLQAFFLYRPAGESRGPIGFTAQDAQLVRDDFDHFHLTSTRRDKERARVIFTRQGLGWKLTDIRLPPEATSPAPAAPPAG